VRSTCFRPAIVNDMGNSWERADLFFLKDSLERGMSLAEIAGFLRRTADEVRKKAKRVITGKKVEGRKSHAELRPELVALVRQLRRKRPKGGQRSLRDISAELAARGFMNERGKPFSAASINSMLSK
jgi:DNA-binding transcriptional MerR regulator